MASILSAALVMLGLLSTAHAADICEATVLHEVAAIKDVTNVIERGGTDTGIS